METNLRKPSKAELQRWGRLTAEKHRRRERRCLVEGQKVVGELLRSGWKTEALLVMADGDADPSARIPAGLSRPVPLYRLTRREWAALSQDPSPEGVIAVAAIPPPAAPGAIAEAGRGPLLLLCEVNNPSNLGALLRSAHWFGFGGVLLSRGSCEATNPKAVRASMGSLFHLPVAGELDFPALLAALRSRFRIVGSAVREGVAPHPCEGQTALLLGNESHGLPADLLAAVDERWRIPGAGDAESLSLPQAAAIMMYECVRRGER